MPSKPQREEFIGVRLVLSSRPGKMLLFSLSKLNVFFLSRALVFSNQFASICPSYM